MRLFLPALALVGAAQDEPRTRTCTRGSPLWRKGLGNGVVKNGAL